MAAELLNFAGRNVVLTGAASGIGAAALDLLLEREAAVFTLDVVPITGGRSQNITCDLGEEEAIDEAVAELPDRVDVLINCAGIPNGGRFDPPTVMAVNWLGLRHLTEALLSRMNSGGAVVHVASTAGRRWPERRAAIAELVALESFEDGAEWVQANSELVGDGYSFSKEVVQYYTHVRSLETVQRGVRMNSICPGVTKTGLVDDFRRGVGDEAIDRALSIAGRMANPEEMAPPMLFLADEASSSYVNGVNLNIDRGSGAAHLTQAI